MAAALREGETGPSRPNPGAMDPAALVILVGGRGTRMGGADKARLEFRERLFVEHIVARLGFREVVLAGADPSAFSDLGLPAVPDAVPDGGPLAGLAAGLSALEAPRAFVCACDMPLVDPAVVGRLLHLQPSGGVAVPRVDGRAEPLHAVYARECAEVAAGLVGRPVRDLLERVPCRWVEEADLEDLPGWRASFSNVNTPEELERLRRCPP